MKTKITTRHIAICAMIAAIYTVLCLATPMLSYGMLQVRVAEALTLLPVLSPIAIWGVTLGCAISNLVGWLTGANPIGYLDTLFGTSATLIAGILTYKLRHIRYRGLPIASAMAPVICNAIIIGAELSFLETGRLVPLVFLLNAFYVGLGELVACTVLGIPLVRTMEQQNLIPR